MPERPEDGRKGLIHIYYGDGKGKTSCGMGMCCRAAGYGLRVLICQFMKDNSSSERRFLEKSPLVDFLDGLPSETFSRRMTEEEKERHRDFYHANLEKLREMVSGAAYDLLFLDEAVYAVRAGLLSEERLLAFLDGKPERLEVILTGRDPSEELLMRADYISEIRKVRHPFDRGLRARGGIER